MNKQKYRTWVVFCSFLFLALSYAPLPYISLSYADVTPAQKAEYIKKAKDHLKIAQIYQERADRITEEKASRSSQSRGFKNKHLRSVQQNLKKAEEYAKLAGIDFSLILGPKQLSQAVTGESCDGFQSDGIAANDRTLLYKKQPKGLIAYAYSANTFEYQIKKKGLVFNIVDAEGTQLEEQVKISIVKACPKFSDGSNVIFVKDSDLTSYE